MLRILQFLSNDGAFLFEKHNCRIVDSEYSSLFGGIGSVTLRHDGIELRFSLDRDILLLDLGAVGSNDRYSFDIIKQLLTGKVDDKSLMDQENVGFLKDNFESIIDSFSKPKLPGTKATCDQLEQQRAKRLFG